MITLEEHDTTFIYKNLAFKKPQMMYYYQSIFSLDTFYLLKCENKLENNVLCINNNKVSTSIFYYSRNKNK